MSDLIIKKCFFLFALLLAPTCFCGESYPIVDTGVKDCYDNNRKIRKPSKNKPFHGQDAHYLGHKPAYRDNKNGTVTDLVTGLIWLKDPGAKKTLAQAKEEIKTFKFAGKKDWRIPTIKELYSLILFTGTDVNPMAKSTKALQPFIDDRYFKFAYGDTKKGERIIDSQFGTKTIYNSTTMWGNPTLFGVNFADGRIKGYPITFGPSGIAAKTFYFLYVRGNPDYGKNDFVDNKNGTITDKATGLMWMQVDSGALKAGDWKLGGLNWEQALKWAENLEYAGHKDWRLPNVKELQSIVDYTRSPLVTSSPSINPLFKLSMLTDEAGKTNYPFYWTSTTHLAYKEDARTADYIAFGQALGFLMGRNGKYYCVDVHGAGAQRSDPKNGNPKLYPTGRGPQGDVIRIYNFVIAVRGGKVKSR